MSHVSLPKPDNLMKEVRSRIEDDLNRRRTQVKEEFVAKATDAVEAKRTSIEIQFNRNNDSEVILLLEFQKELKDKGYSFVVNKEGPWNNVVVSLNNI